MTISSHPSSALRPSSRQSGRAGGQPQRPAPGGFTLIELIAVIIVLGILALTLTTRPGSLGGAAIARAGEVRAQIRFVQLRAMKTGNVCGIKCDSSTQTYWAFNFNSTNPTNTSNYLSLPGETSNVVDMSTATGKAMSMTSFTYYFDGFGIPYTAYTSSTTNTKLAAVASITIAAGSDTSSLTIAPETGYVQ